MNAYLARHKDFFVEVYTVKRETIAIWKNQTLKKQIERMNISGSEEYKLLAFSASNEEHRRCKMVTKQSSEQFVVRPAPALSRVGEEFVQNQSGEPVYAVVDLKNKYDQRKKRSALMEEKRCSSYESIYHVDENDTNKKSLESLCDAVYEDGDAYFNGINGHCLLENSNNEVEENIYEPINVGRKTSMFEFRKYISRLKLNPFLRTATTRSIKPNGVGDAKVPPANGTMSRFSTLRWKLGKHRKSVQRRMRKLYTSEYEPNPLFQYQTEEGHKTLSTTNTNSTTNNSELENESTNNLKEEITTKRQTECCNTEILNGLPTFRKAVAKIPLLNIAAVKNAPQQ